MLWSNRNVLAILIALSGIAIASGVITCSRAFAQATPPAPPAPAGGVDSSDNKISVATAPPVIVSTVPPAGATDVDAAAVTELKITFSKEMEPGNVSWVRFGKDTFPKTTGKAKFLDDKRTCVLPVKLEPGHPYVIWFNKAPYDSFMDTSGHKAVPYLLVFETKK